MEEEKEFVPMDLSFFEQPTLELAKNLLGCLLVKETKEGVTAGFIVETEAYKGPMDRAAHSFNNRRTKRTEIMFHAPGHVYTYVMHTHCLVNVVSAEEGKPEAVLIRAVEPYEGIDLMFERRGGTTLKNLTSGPGKLTKAMGITMEDYGRRFHEPPLFITKGFAPSDISAGPRIGIDNSGEARDYPWRFWVTGNQFVSR
ncbi:DNA-3-methyladenine glycosylase [Bacillus thermotolerans]|uniref:Putative 3-methyladenine DNA glycosylase n=1 Tax=Bacillus thermotolerans TaxID=1221996 RepID=A0A0F5I4W5_BACTR|nr:DNA-3-methyladenine glycosylase [Bacillus thermotolerans]KKB40177.1 DNA-3-methyladenine glycosylase II [Bacillus thermotolerans]KKB42614.1 DNA-3-methyladenine glycosylase II [Bacillus thermotolerans]